MRGPKAAGVTRSSSARQMFSATLNVSNNAKCWNTMPILRRRASAGLWMTTSRPSQTMRPASGRITP